jgi:predicted TIM-barrel fold metal-dependent hydrolase
LVVGVICSEALEAIDDLGLDADAKAYFLGGNAARVFRIDHRA